MPEVIDAAGEIEEILARLVAAGVDTPAALATLLGVEEPLIGRPRRALLRVGIVAADAGGKLHLAPRGQAWLRLPEKHEPSAPPPVIELPALEALPSPLLPPLPAPTPKPAPKPAPVQRVRLARLPRLRVPTLVLDRRIAVVGASVMLVAVAGQAGVYSFHRSSQMPPLAAPVGAPAAPTSTPPANPAAPTPTPERWMTVQNTHGLGLVLRPAPASGSRVLLLQEGARVRVTGSSVQRAGHVWLPVTSTHGTSGWVAGEFLAPEW